MYQERRALLERLQTFESSAKYFSEERRALTADATDRHIEYAKARLDRIDSMIARSETPPHP